MAIEFFQEEGRGFEPKASIRKQGQIGLNQGAVARFKIKNNQPLLLGYDREKKMIAIRLLQEKQKGAKKAVLRNNNATIGAKGFLDYFDISYQEKTRAFDVFEENGLMCFKIE